MISEIVINRPNGKTRRIRERHTDKLGRVYVQSFDVALDTNVNALLIEHADSLAFELIDQEFQEYISKIESGKNPFRDELNNSVNPNFQTRNEMLSKVLTKVCSSSDPTLFMKGAPFLANLTDAELIALMGITQTVVDDIRAKVVSISDTANFLTNYIAPLGAK